MTEVCSEIGSIFCTLNERRVVRPAETFVFRIDNLVLRWIRFFFQCEEKGHDAQVPGRK